MRKQTESLLKESNLGVLKEQYPQIGDLLMSLRMDVCDDDATLLDNLSHVAERHFEDFGTTRARFIDDVAQIIDGALTIEAPVLQIESLTIHEGRDKAGQPELPSLTLYAGEVVGLVGRTGAGKSQLLADIECLAQGDTPSGRKVLINGEVPDDALRMSIDNHVVVQLSQNMNFIMDHSVERFLRIHAACRRDFGGDEDAFSDLVDHVFAYANTLAGEQFSLDTPVTQLSGGQSRALMIADTLLLSESPIILIDEIENAGIDRKKAVELLASSEKIVLISTHDPLLALSCDRRLVIKNGGVSKVIETSGVEQRNRLVLDDFYHRLMSLRERLRDGEEILDDLEEQLAAAAAVKP